MEKLLIDILQTHTTIPFSQLQKNYPSARFRHFSNGQLILTKGEKNSKVAILVNGRVDIANELIDNEIHIIDQQNAPNILGYTEALSGFDVYSAYVIANGKCTVLYVDTKQFTDLLLNNAQLCFLTLLKFNEIQDNTSQQLEKYRIMPKEDIIGHFFYNEAKGNLPYICPYKREALASLLYINLRTLYRYIDLLQQENYLVLRRGKIMIEETQFINLEKKYGNIVL